MCEWVTDWVSDSGKHQYKILRTCQLLLSYKIKYYNRNRKGSDQRGQFPRWWYKNKLIIIWTVNEGIVLFKNCEMIKLWLRWHGDILTWTMTPIPIMLLSVVHQWTPRTPTPDWDHRHHHQRSTASAGKWELSVRGAKGLQQVFIIQLSGVG